MDTSKHHCRFCGHLLPVQDSEGNLVLKRKCVKCGDFIPEDSLYLKCTKCRNEEYKLAYATDGYTKEAHSRVKARQAQKYKDSITKRYEDWQARLSKIKTHTLTEDEWLKACFFFNGCAWCGDEHIEARQYFIAFRHGGSYTACNILPACEKCAIRLYNIPNSFYKFNSIDMDMYRSTKLPKENLQRIIQYLEERMCECEQIQRKAESV